MSARMKKICILAVIAAAVQALAAPKESECCKKSFSIECTRYVLRISHECMKMCVRSIQKTTEKKDSLGTDTSKTDPAFIDSNPLFAAQPASIFGKDFPNASSRNDVSDRVRLFAFKREDRLN